MQFVILRALALEALGEFVQVLFGRLSETFEFLANEKKSTAFRLQIGVQTCVPPPGACSQLGIALFPRLSPPRSAEQLSACEYLDVS
jgi:hypothetical protein